MHSYRLWDFMYYPNIALNLAMVQPFTWSTEMGQPCHSSPHGSGLKWLLIKVWFIFGAVNLIYQNFGMIISLLAPQLANFADDVQLVAQISETGGIMGLTLVAVCKMFVLFWHGQRISKLLEELQEMFPREHEQLATSTCNMQSYRLWDFMYYPNFALNLAMVQPFTWSAEIDQRWYSSRHGCGMKWLLIKVWFIFGSVNLVYQNFGMVINLLAPQLLNFAEDVQLVALLSETGSIMGLTVVGACKMFVLFWHRKRISKLVEELQEIFPHKTEQLDTHSLYRVGHFAHSSRTLMKRTTIFFLFAFCFYNSLPIGELLYEYLSPDRQIMYRYQSNTWYPWQTKDNAKTWWNFAVAYLCQVQSSLTGVAFIMAGEFMLCFFITQMQMHFDYLTNALRNLDAASVKANTKLKCLIIYHIKLLRYSEEINLIFNISFLVNFITSSIAICLMAFSMVMLSLAHTFKYSVGLLSFLVFNFFICYNGSEFTAANDELMPAAFYNNWYEGDTIYRRMILIFMMRSCESNVLRAYKFTTVSMPTFMAILKFSYQLFTFVRAVG